MSTANGTLPHDAREAAEMYLRVGLAPIPLPPRSKKPSIEGWEQLRLKAEDLDRFFPPDQDRNVAILNGAPSDNTADVDLDCEEARRVAPHFLPATGWVFGRTSAPRSHRIYRTDRALEKAQEEYADPDGTMLVELRGTGGLTVYPPSSHRETGERITWERFTERAEVKLTDLQQAVRELAAGALLARHWPYRGSRDKAAMALSGGLAKAGWAEERISRFVGSVALAAGDEEASMRAGKAGPTTRKLEEGKSITGWRRLAALLCPAGPEVVDLAVKWLGLKGPKITLGGKKTVVVLEPYQPFPVQALPEPLAAYVAQAAAALGCDPAFPALPAMAVVTSAVGNVRTIRLKRGWDEPSVLWSCVVADSGTVKSPAWMKCLAPLFRLQAQLMQEYKQKVVTYQEEMTAYKEKQRAAKEDGTDPGEPPEVPVLQRVVCSDTTIEKLAEILEDNPRGVLVTRDELSGWLASFCRYKGKHGGTDLPNWLEMHRAGTVIVDRKTGERRYLFIPRAAASVTGGIQPGVLARVLTPDFLDAGLPARLLMAMPIKKPKRWSEVEVDPEVEQAYLNLLQGLLALDFDQDQDGERVPHALKFSPEAKAVWEAFYNAWAREQAAAEGELAAAFAKLEAYAARLALLHHVVTCVGLGVDDRRDIGRRSVEAGITLARWFGTEARRIYALLGETEKDRKCRRLVEFIRSQGGRMTVRRLQRSSPTKYPKAEHAEAALEELVGAELAEWQPTSTTAKGGHPTRECVLRPALTVDTTDTTTDGEDPDAPDDLTEPPDTTPPQDPGGLGPGGRDCDVTPDFIKSSDQTDRQTTAGCVSSVNCQSDGERADKPGGPVDGQAEMLCQPDRVVSTSSVPAFVVVEDQETLASVQVAVEESNLVGLDLETTGLDSRQDRLRLLSLSTARGTWLVDCFAVNPRPLWPGLSKTVLIGHNLGFDLGFLAALGFTPGEVRDTMLISQVVYAGRHVPHKLQDCAGRELQRSLDKGEQKSDWGRKLTPEQVAYAAADVDVLVPLYQALDAKARDAGLEAVVDIEHRALPAVVWLARSGVAFDVDTWRALGASAAAEADRLVKDLDAAAPSPNQPGMFDGAGWNWDSPAQVRKALEAVGCRVETTDDDALAKLQHPLADVLRKYREAQKRRTTYGTEWLQHVSSDGRVHAGWRQIGAKTGRMSSSAPNLQNVPRGAHRRCFRAPAGRALVKADYSQIELRIAAKMAGETRMIDAYRRGNDLHALTARQITGKEQVSREERQLAKPVNFGLIYGLGGPSLVAKARSEYGVELSLEQAQSYRRAFFAAWPKIAAWHQRLQRTQPTETRTLAGRRCLVDADLFFGAKANYAVQGTGGDGIKRALALLWERRDQAPGTFPLLAVHDEIVVECDGDQADVVAGWLKGAMIDAMRDWLDPVPVEVEVKVAPTWGGE